MLLKAPSHEWTDEVECIILEDENISDGEDEDFSEYMWMEHEEEFNQTELQRLEDEECMRECLEAMLSDELEAQLTAWEIIKTDDTVTATHVVQHSKLNPLAAEFIPLALRKMESKPLTTQVTAEKCPTL